MTDEDRPDKDPKGGTRPVVESQRPKPQPTPER